MDLCCPQPHHNSLLTLHGHLSTSCPLLNHSHTLLQNSPFPSRGWDPKAECPAVIANLLPLKDHGDAELSGLCHPATASQTARQTSCCPLHSCTADARSRSTSQTHSHRLELVKRMGTREVASAAMAVSEPELAHGLGGPESLC
jgi:hypothetical protein